MNPHETHEITELIGQLRDEGGYTILVIEHDMHVVEGISDRVVALDHGVKIAEGSFDEVATDPRVDRGLPRAARRRGAAEPRATHEAAASSRSSSRRRHVLRRDPHPPGRLDRGARGRARLPARRQRLREVDDAEDDPRHRPAAARARSSSPARTSPSGTTSYRIAQGHGDRAREPAPVRADDRARRTSRWAPTCAGRRRRSERTSSASTTLPAAERSAAPSSRGRSRAASSRWSRWGAR